MDSKALFLLAICLFSVTIAERANLGRFFHQKPPHYEPLPEEHPSNVCPRGFKRNTTEEKGIFESLSAEEYTIVVEFLLDQPELDLTATDDENLQLSDNYIFYIEWNYPVKTEALDYLDNNGPKPDRAARVTIYRGSQLDVVIYKVGPLPNPTYYTQINLTRVIPWNARVPDGFEYALMEPVIAAAMDELEVIVDESFGGWNYDSDCELCLWWTDSAPRGFNAEDRHTWLWFTMNTDGKYLQHVGLDFLIDHRGTNSSEWFIAAIVYNSMRFNSTTELIDAYNTEGFKKIYIDPIDADTEDANSWSGLHPHGKRSKSDKKSPPRTYEPDGHRWAQIGNNRISYMDWTFDFAPVPSSGVHIFDARFKGERIIYELGIKESLATYAGYDPIQSASQYLDSSWGLGTSLYELSAGVDCPHNAEFYNYTFWSGGTLFTLKNSICIFEQEIGFPARRHYDSDFEGSFTFSSSTKGVALVVRSTAPVYNYDYVFDYIFYPNAVVEAKFALGGYLQGVYYSNNNNHESNYGTRIHKYSMGSLHEHIAGYKLDLDIGGTDNTFQLVHFDEEIVSVPFYDVPIKSKKIRRENITNDLNGGIKMHFTKPSLWVVTNQNKKNEWGETKGYRIHVTAPIYHVAGDSDRIIGGSYAKYQIGVTKHKDNENYINSHHCQAIPILCPQHFDDYLDGDDISNTDIVNWISVGSFHVPIAEDVPTQETYGYGHSIIIRPFNYFGSDPGMNVRSGGVFYTKDEDGGLETIQSLDTANCKPRKKLAEFNGDYLNDD